MKGNSSLLYYVINKPYGMLSQFTDKDGRATLSNLHEFPKDVYPVGRLDYDSEGLLILTNDKFLTDFLLNPKNKHEREYYLQVEGIPTKETLTKLEKGLIIEGKKTLPAKAKFLGEEIGISERNPPIRYRKNKPTSWISLTLIEGKNRQVRKMTAAVGFPTLRLIRVRIEKIKIEILGPFSVIELTKNEVFSLIKN